MKSRIITLSKAQKRSLFDGFTGNGVLFLKTAPDEFTTIEVYTGKDNRLRLSLIHI